MQSLNSKIRHQNINISSMFRSLVHTSTNLIFSKRIKFIFFVCNCKRFCQGHLYTFCSTTSRLGIFLTDANSWRSTADITIMSCNFQDKHHNYGIFPFQSHYTRVKTELGITKHRVHNFWQNFQKLKKSAIIRPEMN